MKLINQSPELVKIVRFGLVGISNVTVDFSVFNLLMWLSLNPYISSIISYALAMTNSFVFNRRWTFSDGQRNPYKQYLQFMVANAIGFIFNLSFVYLFNRYLNFGNPTITNNAAKLLAVALIVVWNYMISRYVIFKPNSNS